jgi:hypothetical protein
MTRCTTTGVHDSFSGDVAGIAPAPVLTQRADDGIEQRSAHASDNRHIQKQPRPPERDSDDSHQQCARNAGNAAGKRNAA